MAPSSVRVLLAICTVAALAGVSTSSTVSRGKRADDGGPLEAVVEGLSQQVSSFSAHLDTVNAELAALKAKTDTLDRMVAFYAWHTTNPLQALPHGTLIFNHPVTNVGNAYDAETGIFTAPLAGLYEFHATIMEYHLTGVVRAGLYVDGSLMATAPSDNRHGANYHQSTVQVVVHLNSGSRVAVKNTDSTAADYYVALNEPYASFSGVLIKAD